MRVVFLDHQATTPLLPEVLEAMQPYFAVQFGNPSSLHRYGLEAREAIARAREQVAGLIHAATPEDIIFTSGGTEAANLAVKGTAYANPRRGCHLVISDIEHPSVIESIEFLKSHGYIATRVKVDSEGVIDPEMVRAALTPETILIAVHHVNHDLGTIEPIREIGQIAAENGIAFFVDAVASGGWLPIDVQELNCTFLSLSPHRFYGPKGVGVLYRNRRARLASVMHGGNQEGGRRAGTENVPAIVGAGKAAELAHNDLSERISTTRRLQRQLWDAIDARVPYVRLNGPPPGAGRLSTNLNLSVEFLEGEGMALALDMHGIAVASGPSCVSKALKIPPVLAAIGLPAPLAQANLIFSLGMENTADEIHYVIETFAGVVNKLRAMSEAWEEFNRGEADSLVRPRSTGKPSAGVPISVTTS